MPRTLITLVLLLLPVFGNGALPNTLEYQGQLQNLDGSGVTGSKAMDFRLFSEASGGTAVWTETHTTVQLTNGVFSVELGLQTQLTDDLFANQLYLEIHIDGDNGPLAPRLKLATTPYAFTASSIPNNTPVCPANCDNCSDSSTCTACSAGYVVDSADGSCALDTDSDGVADALDNCPNIVNANQANFDAAFAGGDALGDACDTDDDADGVVEDGSDLCLFSVDGITDANSNGCEDSMEDMDSDGFSTVQGDCNDNSASVFPGATEICDGQDNDCDGTVDLNAFSLSLCDGDGDGASPAQGDCNDGDAVVFPGATEICDSKDNDCDVSVDEGGVCAVDADNDGFDTTTDCDDTNAAVNPGAPEICGDSLDNDCDPATLDLFDGDGDGSMCNVDCDDANALINPSAAEICGDSLDNDCNPATIDLFDTDLDGANCSLDCDDNNPFNTPGAPEVCDGQDNNCDSLIDEGGVCSGGGPGPCTSNADCAAGEFCDSLTQMCIPGSGGGAGAICTFDSDCAAGEVCDPLSGTCTAGGGGAGCLSDSDCAGGTCDVVTGVCQSSGGGIACTNDVDCNVVNGFCGTDGFCVENP